MLVLASILGPTVLLLCILLALLYIYTKTQFDYWKKRNVPGPEPQPFVGNIWDVLSLKHSIGTYFESLYKSSDSPYIGIFIFDEPCLVVNSPDIIKDILVKDFNCFRNRTIALPQHDKVFANMLFVQRGSQWANNRARLTPVLTSGKFKYMFPIMRDLGHSFVKYLRENPQKVNLQIVAINYTIDVIAKCFFGVNAQAFENKTSAFPFVGKAMFQPTFRNSFNQAIYFFKASFVKYLRLDFFQPCHMKYFIDEFLNTFEERKQREIQHNDFVDTLIGIAEKDPTFDKVQMAGSAIQFFNAGFEPSSTTLMFILYEMSVNADVQEKAREEILSSLQKAGGFTYDDVSQLKYLHMCIMETLRKYTPLPFLDRRCEKDYHVKGTDLVIEKGTAIYISPLAIQNDEKYFPEPQRFIPERFKENVNAERLIHLPFGYGPRMCIGFRFGLLSIKLAVIHVLTNFQLQTIPETKMNVEFESTFTLQPKGELLINFEPLVRQN